ncbi:MAG: hypothetical protein F6J87_30885 [Spirulina sp. SIO3F2]|nr:hypothetical protein [Spirulina sp. SIO3F2]
MATALFAGLKLELAVIKRIMRSRAMRESVFYQDIVQESEKRGVRKGYMKLLRQLVPFLKGFNVPIESLLKRIGVTQAELDAAAELDEA